jgi:hypothetical protein
MKVGDRVAITEQYDNVEEVKSSEIQCKGYKGTLIKIKTEKGSLYPYLVEIDGKGKWIFKEGELEVVND